MAPLLLAVLTITPMTQASVHQFSEGQIWNYRTRSEDPASTLLINKVEAVPKLGEVYHISVRSVHVRNQHAPAGVSTELPHIPVSRRTLELGVTALVGESAANPDYAEGYETWRKAFEKGDAGVFTVSVAEIVSFVESTLSQ